MPRTPDGSRYVHPDRTYRIEFEERPPIEHDDGTYSCPNSWCDKPEYRWDTITGMNGHRSMCDAREYGPFECPVEGCFREFTTPAGRSSHVTKVHVAGIGREAFPDGPPERGSRRSPGGGR